MLPPWLEKVRDQVVAAGVVLALSGSAGWSFFRGWQLDYVLTERVGSTEVVIRNGQAEKSIDGAWLNVSVPEAATVVMTRLYDGTAVRPEAPVAGVWRFRPSGWRIDPGDGVQIVASCPPRELSFFVGGKDFGMGRRTVDTYRQVGMGVLAVLGVVAIWRVSGWARRRARRRRDLVALRAAATFAGLEVGQQTLSLALDLLPVHSGPERHLGAILDAFHRERTDD